MNDLDDSSAPRPARRRKSSAGLRLGIPRRRGQVSVVPPETCPNCGADVPPNARSCPECGADDATGWNDRAAGQSLGISDPDDFDHAEWEREELGEARSPGQAWYWIVIAVLLLAALLFMFIPR